MIVIFLKKKLNFLNIYAHFAFASGLKKAFECDSEAFQSENYMFFDFFLPDNFARESPQVDILVIGGFQCCGIRSVRGATRVVSNKSSNSEFLIVNCV